MRVSRLFLFAASFGLAGLVKRVYRPWAYQHGVSDLGVADSAPSLLYVFGMGLLVATVAGTSARLRPLKYVTIVGVGAGALVYEISQAFRRDRWFSWTDVIATVLGVFGAVLVERALTKAEDKPGTPSVDRRA